MPGTILATSGQCPKRLYQVNAHCRLHARDFRTVVLHNFDSQFSVSLPPQRDWARWWSRAVEWTPILSRWMLHIGSCNPRFFLAVPGFVGAGWCKPGTIIAASVQPSNRFCNFWIPCPSTYPRCRPPIRFLQYSLRPRYRTLPAGSPIRHTSSYVAKYPQVPLASCLLQASRTS